METISLSSFLVILFIPWFRPVLNDKLNWHPGSNRGCEEAQPMAKITAIACVILRQLYLQIRGGLPSFNLWKETRARINDTNKNATLLLCTVVISEGKASLAMNFPGLLHVSHSTKVTLDSKCNFSSLNAAVAHFLLKEKNWMLHFSYKFAVGRGL